MTRRKSLDNFNTIILAEICQYREKFQEALDILKETFPLDESRPSIPLEPYLYQLKTQIESACAQV